MLPTRLVAAAVFLGLGGAAHAVELPQRDPTEECRSQAAYDAATYSFDEAVEIGRCVSVAQDYYDALKQDWSSVPEAVQAACIEAVDSEHTIDTLFYWSLYQCVDARRDGGPVANVSFRFEGA